MHNNDIYQITTAATTIRRTAMIFISDIYFGNFKILQFGHLLIFFDFT